MTRPRPSHPRWLQWAHEQRQRTQSLRTLMVATCNGQKPYSQREFDAKVGWPGQRFESLNADVLAVKEVWNESALRAAV
jgi:hypothetical protein